MGGGERAAKIIECRGLWVAGKSRLGKEVSGPSAVTWQLADCRAATVISKGRGWGRDGKGVGFFFLVPISRDCAPANVQHRGPGNMWREAGSHTHVLTCILFSC